MLKGHLIRCATPVPPNPSTHPWKVQRMVTLEGLVVDPKGKHLHIQGVFQPPLGPASVFSTEPFNRNQIKSWESSLQKKSYHFNPLGAKFLRQTHPHLKIKIKPFPRRCPPCPPPKPPKDVILKTFVISLKDHQVVSRFENRYDVPKFEEKPDDIVKQPKDKDNPEVIVKQDAKNPIINEFIEWKVLSRYLSS